MLTISCQQIHLKNNVKGSIEFRYKREGEREMGGK